ncbi:MAG TPA: hypothetical protein VKH81_13720 [Candidatus Angelobacter sp.]|nr:hypothetical protein [Candidatus Angelobacter sp.]
MSKLLLVALLLCGSLAFAQAKKAPAETKKTAPAADPWIGNWKLDIAHSKFHDPAPKEETLTVDAASKDAVKYSTKGTAADGSAYTEAYEGKADGKEYPLTRNGQPVAKIAYHRNTAHNSTGKATVTEGVTFTESATVSNDGKTLTVKQHFTTPAGEFDNVAIFHKIS